MALLQISEPGQSPRRRTSDRIAVGIDLGTTHSLVAARAPAAWPSGAARRGQGRLLLPSVVRYAADGRRSGRCGERRALSTQADDPEQHAWCRSKRFMGRKLSDEVADRQPGCPTRFVEALPGTAVGMRHTAQGLVKSPVEVSARRFWRHTEASAPRTRFDDAAVRRRDHGSGLFRRRRSAQATKDAAATGRPERAAPDQRAHGRGRGLRPGPAADEGLYAGVRPGRRHLRHLAAAAAQVVCSRWWPPAVTPQLGGDDIDHAAGRLGVRRRGGCHRRLAGRAGRAALVASRHTGQRSAEQCTNAGTCGRLRIAGRRSCRNSVTRSARCSRPT